MSDKVFAKYDSVQSAQLDALIEFLDTIARSMAASGTIVHFLNHPAIPHAQKRKALAVMFHKEVPESFDRVIRRLISQRVVSHVPGIVNQLKAMRDASLGLRKVIVNSAVAMPDDQKKVLTKKISSMFNKELVPVFQVQPDLIAGFSIAVDSVVIENSIASDLHALTAEFSDFSKG